MDSGTISPADDGAPGAAGDTARIELPDDPRVPQAEDADPSVSKDLGGAAPAVGPGRSPEDDAATRDGTR